MSRRWGGFRGGVKERKKYDVQLESRLSRQRKDSGRTAAKAVNPVSPTGGVCTVRSSFCDRPPAVMDEFAAKDEARRGRSRLISSEPFLRGLSSRLTLSVRSGRFNLCECIYAAHRSSIYTHTELVRALPVCSHSYPFPRHPRFVLPFVGFKKPAAASWGFISGRATFSGRSHGRDHFVPSRKAAVGSYLWRRRERIFYAWRALRALSARACVRRSYLRAAQTTSFLAWCLPVQFHLAN